ncbi:hypothetical protein FUAX_48850 (plasmid) [Fulvitalea axinellae]|uniref:Uncharacterized protein n=1 Tax=Fulvitalea axinellae TaxID=1182444 RepID=A0AAU9CWV5_9BACT|nr:hypothetical protein FUAX_48850 [Fulvitalea axinellae]
MFSDQSHRPKKTRNEPSSDCGSRMPPVQAYMYMGYDRESGYFPVGKSARFESLVLDSADYKFGHDLHTQTIFDDESYLLEIKDVEGGEIRQTDKNDDASMFAPTLKASYGADLAVEDTDEAKVFYATEEKAAESNRVFRDKGGDLELWQDKSSGISVPDMFGMERNELFLTGVSYRGDRERVGKYSDCSAFVQNVLGYSYGRCREVVLEQVDMTYNLLEKARVPLSFGTENRLADYFVNREAPSPRGCAAFVSLDERADCTEVVRSFREMEEDDKARRSHALGVNNYVYPNVGEGFMMTGITGERISKTLDPHQYPDSYEEHLENEGIRVRGSLADCYTTRWNMHNAGVVARSGVDFVTMENYTRSYMPDFYVIQEFNAFFCGSEAFRKYLEEYFRRKDALGRPFQFSYKTETRRRAQNIKILLRKLSELQELGGRAQRRLDSLAKIDMTRLEKEDQNRLFHFKMYGVEDRQDFHGAKMGIISGVPMAVRVRVDFETAKQNCLDRVHKSETKLDKAFATPGFMPGLPQYEEKLTEFRRTYKDAVPYLERGIQRARNQEELRRTMLTFKRFKKESKDLTKSLVVLTAERYDLELKEDFFHTSTPLSLWIKNIKDNPQMTKELECIRDNYGRPYWAFHEPKLSLSFN